MAVMMSGLDQLQISILKLQPNPELMGCFLDSYLQGSNDEIRLAAIQTCVQKYKYMRVAIKNTHDPFIW